MIKINLMPEKWKVIPHSPDYAVSNQGRVMRITDDNPTYPGRMLKRQSDKDGYLRVFFSKHNRITKPYKVSRLVALCFLGPCPLGKQVNHKNAIKTDDTPDNLEYLTPKENTNHAISLGLWKPPKGESHWHTKLTEKDVLAIVELGNLGWSLPKIGKQFNISKQTIFDILHGRRWNWLTNIRKPHVS